MKWTYRVFAICALAALAEDAAPITSISVSDGHPVWEIARQLQERYGYAITYEDPRYQNDDDHDDIGMKVRNLTLQVPDTQTISTEDLAGILQRLVQLQETQRTGGRFRVLQTGNQFHIVPTAVRDSNGNWIAQSSILDTPISLPLQARTPGGMLKAICDAIDTAAHVQISIVSNFGSIAASRSDYTVGADNESARRVLMRGLATVSPDASWVITHDQANKYFLMITGYPLKTARSVAASSSPRQTSTQSFSPAASR
jgi:hypothetical protein